MSRLRAPAPVACLALAALLTFGCAGRNESAAPTVAPAPTQATAVAQLAPPTATAQPTGAAAPVGPPQSADRVESGAEPPPGQPVPPEARATYRRIEQAVARIRGLAPTGEVELRSMTEAQLGEYLRRSFEKDYSPEERARDQKLLSILGMIEPDRDLAALMLGLLTSEIAGLYDQDDRRMYVIAESSAPSASTKVTFAHEFTHALQDQHFNLKQLDPPEGEDDDRSAAIEALVEGDAVVTMGVYAREELTAGERRQYVQERQGAGPSAFDEAPLVIRESLIFPYDAGARFVAELYRRGGFAAVDAAYRNPPRSTEQIIHPEKYVAGEAPIEVSLPDLSAALGGGWRQTDSSTLGELDLRIMVEQDTDRPTAERAASGWGGARYAMLEEAGRATVVFRTAWDSSQDAWEFSQAYRRALRNRLGSQARVLADTPERQALASTDLATLVALQGRDVVVVLAPDEAIMSRLAQELTGS